MTLCNSLEDQIKAEAPGLLTELGLVYSGGYFAAGHFGDSQAVLTGPQLAIRLTREKGVLTLELGPSQDPPEFWDYVDVKQAMKPPPEIDELLSLASVEEFLTHHWNELTGIFGVDYESVRQRLNKAKNDRVSRWRAWLQGGDKEPC